MFKSSQQTLEQFKEVLMQLPENCYAKPCETLSQATIGQHTRHIIEFFQCLIEQASTGFVNYDLRTRNIKIEDDNDIAVQEIEKIISAIEKLNGINTEIQLVTTDGFEIPYSMTTSIDREIWYNVEHTIHHMAIIRMTLSHHLPHIKINKEFGVAFSTLKFISDTSIKN